MSEKNNKRTLLNKLLILMIRNIETIEDYRLNSIFHLKSHFFDYVFAYNNFTKNIFRVYFRFFSILSYLLNKKLSIKSMDFNLTTSCSLRCRYCASLMPFYDKEHQWTMTFDQFKQDLDKFLQGVDKIYRFKLIGGEPLLVKDLDKMLEYSCKQKQIVSVEIITNGTIIPSDEICSILQANKDKALVIISDYTKNTELKNLKNIEIITKLNQYGAIWFNSNYKWYEVGDIYKRNRSTNEIKEVFSKCWQRDCIALMDGKFHHCTRSIAIQRLTDHKFNEDEFIDIRIEPKKNIIKKIRHFFTKDYFSVCDFCMSASEVRLNPSVQTSEILKISS